MAIAHFRRLFEDGKAKRRGTYVSLLNKEHTVQALVVDKELMLDLESVTDRMDDYDSNFFHPAKVPDKSVGALVNVEWLIGALKVLSDDDENVIVKVTKDRTDYPLVLVGQTSETRIAIAPRIPYEDPEKKQLDDEMGGKYSGVVKRAMRDKGKAHPHGKVC